MNADHYFTIGKPHFTGGTPCEDYALSGEIQSGLAFAVVSDGCGDPRLNAHTDIGARALAFAFKTTLDARKALDSGWLDGGFTWRNGFCEDLLNNFRRNQFTGHERDYLATLVGLVATPTAAQALLFGDGAIGIRYADGRVALLEVEWQGNAPFYLAYCQTPERFLRFQAELSADMPHFVLNQTVWRTGDTGLEFLEEHKTRYNFNDVREGLVLTFSPQTEGIEALSVLSDGIGKVGDLPAPQALHELMAFKNHEGAFVKRRMMRGLASLAKQGQVPQDDLSMACIWFGAAAEKGD